MKKQIECHFRAYCPIEVDIPDNLLETLEDCNGFEVSNWFRDKNEKNEKIVDLFQILSDGIFKNADQLEFDDIDIYVNEEGEE